MCIVINQHIASKKLFQIDMIDNLISPEMINELDFQLTSCELQVTIYEFLFITFHIRFTSYYLLHELRVIFKMRVTSYYLLLELRVNFYIRVTSCYLLPDLRVTFSISVTTT